MEWNNETTGSLKYSPPISAEKIVETTTNSFSQLCRTDTGREIASIIISNYIEDDKPRNSKPLFRRHEIPKIGTGKKLPKIRSDVDES